MAATISVNFANEQEVYDESDDTLSIRAKKSVSAKLLQDVLGGGVVSGGYVKRTGDSMTGYLTLTSVPPVDNYHAASKLYVDSHAYTRRYYYQCGTNTEKYGIVPPGGNAISGLDLYTNQLYFFERGDSSVFGITRYLDVYRDGILQVYGQDYDILNIPGNTFLPGITAIKFEEPFEVGSTVQVNIGNTGAFPVTFGVNFLSGYRGVRTDAISGDVVVYAEPLDYSALDSQIIESERRDVFVSPKTLSAFPLTPRAIGLFQKEDLLYNTEANPKLPGQPFGNSSGEFITLMSEKIISVKSDPDNTFTPNYFRAILEGGTVNTVNYNVTITTNLELKDPYYSSFASVVSETRTLSSFDFFVYDVFSSEPFDVYEISIQVY